MDAHDVLPRPLLEVLLAGLRVAERPFAWVPGPDSRRAPVVHLDEVRARPLRAEGLLLDAEAVLRHHLLADGTEPVLAALRHRAVPFDKLYLLARGQVEPQGMRAFRGHALGFQVNAQFQDALLCFCERHGCVCVFPLAVIHSLGTHV